MLKLERRPLNDFLGPEHQQALRKRTESAKKLAENELTDAQKSKRISAQWDAFRAGRTSQDTAKALWCELLAMAFNKCAFCETPAPDTVEHLEEKSRAPAKAFDWANLLAACSTCNRNRQCSGITATPMDPSTIEPMDHFGWDEYGDFAPAPAHRDVVLDHVRMYGLTRFKEERKKTVLALRALLASVVFEEPLGATTRDALRAVLSGTSAWLGPVREYLLRPPTENDALVLDEALRQLPELREWVALWLRPPPWAPARWR